MMRSERALSWESRISRNPDGKPEANMHNVMLIATKDPEIYMRLEFDSNTSRSVWCSKPPWETEAGARGYPRYTSEHDADYAILWVAEKYGITFGPAILRRAIEAAAAPHPVSVMPKRKPPALSDLKEK